EDAENQPRGPAEDAEAEPAETEEEKHDREADEVGDGADADLADADEEEVALVQAADPAEGVTEREILDDDRGEQEEGDHRPYRLDDPGDDGADDAGGAGAFAVAGGLGQELDDGGDQGEEGDGQEVLAGVADSLADAGLTAAEVDV